MDASFAAMLMNRYAFTICAGLLAATGCSRDAKPAETSASQKNGPAAEEMSRVAASDPVMEPRASEGRAQDELAQTGAGGVASGTAACEPAVYFETDSADLNDTSRERLDTVADCIKRSEIDHATIVGRTDPSGTDRHNQDLGLERAKAVAEYLRGRGVPENQIRVQSKGELAAAGQPVQLWPVERRAGVDVK